MIHSVDLDLDFVGFHLLGNCAAVKVIKMICFHLVVVVVAVIFLNMLMV